MNDSLNTQNFYSHSLVSVLDRFSRYQESENQPKYARSVCARVAEFVDHCRRLEVRSLEDVRSNHIESWLSYSHNALTSSGWKSRHLAIQTFFNWCVFAGLMNAADNPLAVSPRGATLANKLMLTEFDLHRILMVIPDSHYGIQDRLTCLLLWHGCRLSDMNSLTVANVDLFPADAKLVAETMLNHRSHLREKSLWMDPYGQKRVIHGQKLNKRLQQYAMHAELKDPSRVSASLIYQSGAYYRLTSMEA